MKVIFDADSLIYASCFKKKDDRESPEDLFETDVNVAFNKFQVSFGRLLEFLEEQVSVDDVVFCNGSKNNFRKDISATYKLNRTQKRQIYCLYYTIWLSSNTILFMGMVLRQMM